MASLSTIKKRPPNGVPVRREPYRTQSFARLFGTPGFSDKLLTNHFKLYEGYVKNTNALLEEFASTDAEAQHQPKFAEMHRRFGWEFNGMRLHEYYFGNLGRDEGPFERTGAFSKKIEEQFSSFENWKQYFTGIGMMRGIGWAVLAHDRRAGRLLNVWVNEHDTGHLAGTEPLLIMDVFEHAFMTDYGLEKDKYIASFWNAVRWPEVERRFNQVTK